MAGTGWLLSRQRGLSQGAIVLAAASGYELLRRAIRPNWPLATRNARDVLRVERHLHLAWEESLQHFFLRLPVLVEGMNLFYLAGNFALTALFFVWLYRSSTHGFRLFRNGFVIATALGLLIEWRFPTAPPRLAGVGLEDTLRRLSGIDIGIRGSDGLTDPVAAMPSLHAGWALGVALGLTRYAQSLPGKWIGGLYVAGVEMTVIVTGNHFVLDTLAGLALMVCSLAVAATLDGLAVVTFSLRRGVEQSGSSPGS